MTRLLFILMTLSCVGWAVFWFVDEFDLFKTISQLEEWVYAFGLVVTAATLIVAVATFFLKVILLELFNVRPSELIHAIVYSALTLAAVAILLSQFGIDVGAILTTSAILGAVVGLAMQPTLGSIVSGMSMSAEPLLKIGSAIQLDGKTVFIEQKTWRHVVGRRLDNIKVIIPNSMLADMAIQVLPEEGPTRFDVFMHLPPDVPPQQITDLLADAFSDMEHLDATRAVMVAPIETQPETDSILYRIRLWARAYSHVTILEGEVPRRAWYVLNRAGIRQPRNLFYETQPWAEPDAQALEPLIASVVPEDMRDEVPGNVRQYRFAPTEVLRFPPEDQGRAMMILQGEAAPDAEVYLNPMEHGRSARPHLPTMGVQKLSTLASLRKLADRLALDVGPVADLLVRDAMKAAKTPQALVARLADSIEDESARKAFVKSASALTASRKSHAPGTVAQLVRDATGRLIPNPELRALSEVVVATFPNPRAALD